MPWHTILWLSKISQLNFDISVTSGKEARVKRRGFYRTLYTEAEKIISHLQREIIKHRAIMEMVDLPPSLAERLTQKRTLIQNDIDDAEKVIGYSRRRILNGEKIPNSEKIMSLSDGSAAFIVKGDRETVLGYRPQVGRSGNGFVTVLYVPEGNAADSPQLVSLVEDAIKNTGVVSNIVSFDDGYSSTHGIGSTRMIPGVDVASPSGAKGKKVISTEDWESEPYREARRNRSSVESLIFTLKYVYGFGNLRRRGIDAVRIELLEKAIVHNLSRLAALKKKRRQQPVQAA
jgi:IS5 family transposase